MGAPATQGRLCTQLSDMEIGDYIRCTYTAPAANAAGEFSDLGGNVAETKELPTIPGITANGYFYYLKVDKGLLIADRMVQVKVSAQALDKKNYLLGAGNGDKLIRSLSQNEWTKYLTNGDLNGCITKQDANVWHCSSSSIEISISAQYLPDINVEILQDKDKNKVKTALNVNGAKQSNIYHVRLRPTNISPQPTYYYSVYVEINKPSAILTGAQKPYNKEKEHCAFRPSLEYIDNLKSKSIWY